MELNENTGRIGLGFIPTYGRLVSLKRKLSLGGKPVLTGIRERGENHWPIVKGRMH